VEAFADQRGLDPDELLTFVRGAVLDTGAIDEFVNDTAQIQDIGLRHFVSTDDNLALEYATPKGNIPAADHIPTTLGYLYEYKPAGIVRAHLQL
jgi:hypothetical protein